jgi:hypothetical protein
MGAKTYFVFSRCNYENYGLNRYLANNNPLYRQWENNIEDAGMFTRVQANDIVKYLNKYNSLGGYVYGYAEIGI